MGTSWFWKHFIQKTNLDQTDTFKLCDILVVNFGGIPNNNKKLQPSKIIFRNHAYSMKKQTNFFWGEGGIPPIPACSISRKTIFFKKFFTKILICALCILFQWNLNILYIFYQLSHFVTYFIHFFCLHGMRNLAWLLDQNFCY